MGPAGGSGQQRQCLHRALGDARFAFFSAFLMMLADAGSRLAAFPYELPLGLFATLLGTPWLLLHMTRQTR